VYRLRKLGASRCRAQFSPATPLPTPDLPEKEDYVMKRDEDEVLAWLRTKSDKDFFEFVYRAAAGRGTDASDHSWLEAHVVVGHARREKFDDSRTGPWSLQLVALPRDQASSPADAILCEAGSHCGHDLIGWAKEIRCPVCGEDTYAT
jgi:hypothetical protein